jgi:hypothetical protein
MKKIIAQVNHPGSEIEFNVAKIAKQNLNTFLKLGDKWIRDWNTDEMHYRKLILNRGYYLNNLNGVEQEDELLFWGEWEAPSVFQPLENGAFASGIHSPFLTDDNFGRLQNTDPYVFGDYFKYAICSQNGVMTQLAADSLVLFGTTTDKGFILDTVFVVKDSEIASSIQKNQAENYTSTYKKVTLDKISDCYLTDKCKSLKNRIYIGKTWKEDKEYFSFVPCKIANNDSLKKGIEKLCIPFESNKLSFSISSQKVGHPYSHFIGRNEKEIWRELVDYTIDQGYFLGTYFEETTYRNDIVLDKNRFADTISEKKSITKKEKNTIC